MYTKTYKNQIITICKFYMEEECKYYWGFSINGSEVEDYQELKRISLEWAKIIINHPKREELFGHGIKFKN
jgi:hypothetical protein